MKQFILILAIITLVTSCQSEDQKFVLTGNIEGLKKGTLFLQRKIDTVLVTIDSITISGDSNFTITSAIDQPEVLYLKMNKNDDDDGLIRFFADNGPTHVTTTLNQFSLDSKIKGSKQQDILEEYEELMSKLNNRNLDILKKTFDKHSNEDSLVNMDFNAELDKQLKRKYLYTINFAINHKDSEVAPFLAVEEIPNATTKFLDTIFNSLEPKIKSSKYGKELQSILELRKNKN